MCRRSLAEFVKQAWPLIEPATPLLWNWHLEAICLHLQAVTEGRIRKLVINVPPRTGKSSIVAVLWPCWEWARNPAVRFMFASYAQQLSFRDSVRRRLVIESEWFKARWPNVKLSDDQNLKHEFQNTDLGYMVATSTGGTVTGRGGDRLVLDDPNDATQMESEVERESTLTWFDLQWSTRGNNPNTYAEVIIQQRTHEKDITGHALKQGVWVHLKLPMEYAGEKCRTSIGWEDPRTEKGELLDPQRYSKETVANLTRRLGPYGASGQLQQEPAPAEGGIIKRAWIRNYPGSVPSGLSSEIAISEIASGAELWSYKFRPLDHFRLCTIDPATAEKHVSKGMKANDPDYFVIAAWSILITHKGPMVFLLDLIHDRLEGPDQEKKIEAFHEQWKFAIIGVESEGFQLNVFQRLKRMGLPVRELSKSADALYRIDGDKVARAYNATSLMADGRFWVPTYAPWLGEYVKELTTFPAAAHDDLVDATTYAVAIVDQCARSGDWKIFELNGRSVESTESRQDDDSPSDPLAGWKPNVDSMAGWKPRM